MSGTTESVTVLPPGARPPTWRTVFCKILASRWLRFVLAGVVLLTLYWLDRLNPKALLEGAVSWHFIALAFFLYIPLFVLAALRFRLVLNAMGTSYSFRQVWSWTMIGTFGELILPFFAGGDIVRAVYLTPGHGRKFAAMSVLTDRLLGMGGLLLLALIACVIGSPFLLADARFSPLLFGVFTMTLLGLFGIGILYASRGRFSSEGAASLAPRSVLMRIIVSCVSVLGQLIERPRKFVTPLLFALVAHFLGAVLVLTLALGLQVSIPAGKALIVLPLIFFSNIFSFASGIGGGLFAFEYLFQYLLGTAPGEGVKVGLAFVALTNLSKICGLPWYLSYSGRRNVTDDLRNEVRPVPPVERAA